MAFTTTSYVNGYHLGQMMIAGAAYKLGGGSPDTIRVSCYTNSIGTMNSNNQELKGDANFSTGEVVYTGGTPSTFQTLVTPTITVGSNRIKFSDTGTGGSTRAWSTVSWTAYGAVIWDDTLTAPLDPVICAIYFGNSSGIPVSTGTFTITWDSNGIFYATF